MFRALCAHHLEVKIVLYSIWNHHTCRWPSRAPDGHLQLRRTAALDFSKKWSKFHHNVAFQAHNSAQFLTLLFSSIYSQQHTSHDVVFNTSKRLALFPVCIHWKKEPPVYGNSPPTPVAYFISDSVSAKFHKNKTRHGSLTFRWPCTVIYSYYKTN